MSPNALRIGLVAVAGLFALKQPAVGQPAAPQMDVAASVITTQTQYSASFTASPQLYNGPEYVDYAKRYHARDGHQFFVTPELQAGRVYYDGQHFGNLLLTYDVVLDQVVLSPPNSPLTLRLLGERVDSFAIGGHRFVRLVADSAIGNAIRTGFYEVLLDGPVQVLAKRAKRLQEHIVNPNVDVQFTGTDRLFLRKDGICYPINRKSAALRVFSARSKEMQSYLKVNKLSFKNDQFESSIALLASYYSQLSK